MTNSKYNPTTWSEMDAFKSAPYTFGIVNSCAANSTTTFDTLIADDVFIKNLELVLNSHAMGDSITLKIIDKDNVLGFGANFVLATPVTDYNIASDMQKQGGYEAVVPKKIPGGTYLRVQYTATGLLLSVRVMINFISLKALF